MTREMKDSGIEWIGQMPFEWKTIPIQHIFEENKTKNVFSQEKTALKFTYGTIIPKEDFNADTDEYVAKTIENYTVVRPGMIVINCLNLNYDFISQRVGLVKNNGAITSAYLVIIPNEKVNSEYANYQLKTWDSLKAFHNMGTGVRKTLDFSELGKKYFVLPSLQTQIKIVDFLNRKCLKIEGLCKKIKEQINTLEQYKKSVITEVVTKGLNPNVEMKESGIEWIGQIPKNWSAKKAKHAFSNTKRIPGINSYKYDRLSLTLNGVVNRSKEDDEGLQPKDFNTYQLLQSGELVFKLIDLQNISTSRVGLAHATGLVSPAYIVLHPNDSIYPSYAEKYYLMMWYRQIFNSLGDSGVRSSINATELLNLPIIMPPLKNQQEISDYLDTKCSQIDSIISDKKKQLETLEQYKKSLIYEYVTGKKEVPANE